MLSANNFRIFTVAIKHREYVGNFCTRVGNVFLSKIQIQSSATFLIERWFCLVFGSFLDENCFRYRML